jgi:CRISPR-associated protein Cas1
MSTLYVTEPGARIEKEYKRILVTKEDEVLLSVPIAQISEVILIGWAGATTPAMLSLLDQEAGLTLVTRNGKLRGRLKPAHARNLSLRHKQYARSSDPVFCLEISRAIVTGKLKNSRTMLRRILRSERAADNLEIQQTGTNSILRMNHSLAQVSYAKDLAELRGLEGASANAYFHIFKQYLRPELSMEKRTRRPPKDPPNALLSLAYSLLTNAMFTACDVVGLDPYDGFFHADKYGRPALALDLVEEFRSVIADSVVLTLINKRILKEKDFEPGGKSGIYLTKSGMYKFLQQYTKRINTRAYHPVAKRSLSYQKIFEIQARQIRKCIEDDNTKYKPFIRK